MENILIKLKGGGHQLLCRFLPQKDTYIVSFLSSVENMCNSLMGLIIILKMASAKCVGGLLFSSKSGGIRLSHKRRTSPK